jgi:type IV pilus assembly protein PilA
MIRLQRFTSRWLPRQLSRPAQQGFTLIELLVAILIMGILTSIGLPTLVRQVGKAREAEAKNALSSIGFAQQGHFFENRQFAPTYSILGIDLNGKYFDFPEPESIPNTYRTKSQAITKETNALGSSRNYAYGTYYVSDSYQVILCQSPDNITITQVPDDSTGDCIDGVRID